jgi:PIN domain nuclease of toxin-antitoxin system
LLYSARGKLANHGQTILDDYGNDLFYSPISIVEIIIKLQSGKLRLPSSPVEFENNLRKSGYRPLDFTTRQAQTMGDLKSIHKDPFDRMLIAQAIDSHMELMTTDATIGRYISNVIITEHE